jgi:hypothetical protein
MEFIPGGPSPDSAVPSQSPGKPIDTRHQAVASTVDTETHHQGSEMASQRQGPATRELPSDLQTQQPSEHPTGGAPPNHPEGHPSSDEHPENAPAVRVAAAPNGEAVEVSSGKEAGRSPSVATRRSLHTNDVGAVRAANEPTEVDPNLQARATSVNGARTGKEERASSREPHFPSSHPFTRDEVVLTPRPEAHGVGRKLSKIEKRGAKAEKAALQVALKELAEIQELQKASIKVQ